ncbi:MAG: hypothetical protein Q8922_07820 [Bacteroidota bacterium]|nr:hypothetical protein [Bacteroidota bacterium]MDP4287831.1 hypothetical protein [Bacteroidota bacterium]
MSTLSGCGEPARSFEKLERVSDPSAARTAAKYYTTVKKLNLSEQQKLDLVECLESL